jgi:hypothetical protein
MTLEETVCGVIDLWSPFVAPPPPVICTRISLVKIYRSHDARWPTLLNSSTPFTFPRMKI